MVHVHINDVLMIKEYANQCCSPIMKRIEDIVVIKYSHGYPCYLVDAKLQKIKDAIEAAHSQSLTLDQMMDEDYIRDLQEVRKDVRRFGDGQNPIRSAHESVR